MSVRIVVGDSRSALAELPEKSAHTCVCSPPYFGLRDYDHPDQIGLEPTPEAFIANLVEVFRGVRRVLRDDGTLWVVIGDSYAGSGRGGYPGSKGNLQGPTTGQDGSRVAKARQKAGKHAAQVDAGVVGRAWVPPPAGLKNKDLIGIPWMLAFALRADGWFLRQDIIWSKPNPMPESMKDRCCNAHEYMFLLSKSQHYYFDHDAIAEGLATDPSERYEQRARITGRGDQGAAAARGGDRSKSGGFPPRKRGATPRHAKYDSCAQPGLDQVERGGRRTKRSVWTVATKPYADAHFATYPPGLIQDCIKAGAPVGGMVLDPFGGAGTTGLVAERLGRDATLIEVNPGFAAMAQRRLKAHMASVSGADETVGLEPSPLFAGAAA